MSSQKYKKARKTNDAWLKDFIGMICGMGVYVFLFFLMVCYAFYAPEGYIMIATNKYQFFRKMCIITAWIMIPLILLYYISYFIGKGKTFREKGRELIGNLSATDGFVLLFALINMISYFLTDFKEEALWGTDGWYMGFAMHLFFIGIYFIMSRFYDSGIDLLVPFMAVTLVLFSWGLLNRFSVYPVDMQYDSSSFISSMGNINWFCGFWSVFFVIGIVVYMVTEKTWLRIFSGIHACISLALGVVEGSDSAYFSMGVVFLFLFFISFREMKYMKRFLEICIYLCLACQLMRLITIWKPESLNLSTFLSSLMLGNLTLVLLFVFLIFWFIINQAERNYLTESLRIKKNSKKFEEHKKNSFADREWLGRFQWVKYIVVGMIAAVFLLYLVLLVINTKKPGSIGKLSNYSMYFLFDGAWGNGRGASWRDGIDIFKALPPIKKLFGAGPDCFSAFSATVPELAQRLEQEWGGARLTNAHNECITYLVNLGILGLASFIGIFASSFIRLLKRAAKEPLCYVFAASILSYFFHNQFSFSQVENIPYVFMMLGLGENLLRRTKP